MAGKSKPRNSWLTVLLLVAAIALWLYQQPATGLRKTGSPNEKTAPAEKPKPTTKPAAVGKSGAYEVHHGCTLAEARNNDGDSFMVRLPDGKKAEFRLYFVDTPESAFKRYSGGDTNHERIRQQAAEMGGITPEQAVEIGKKSKALTLGLLAEGPFDLFTAWDSPFNDNRFHAHIQIRQNGKPVWLHRLLVERGLARIKTKPADLPDGTSAAAEKETLRNLEHAAKRQDVGVWGLP
jgi:endonuclease YncB( thermonuclease family)